MLSHRIHSKVCRIKPKTGKLGVGNCSRTCAHNGNSSKIRGRSWFRAPLFWYLENRFGFRRFEESAELKISAQNWRKSQMEEDFAEILKQWYKKVFKKCEVLHMWLWLVPRRVFQNYHTKRQRSENLYHSFEFNVFFSKKKSAFHTCTPGNSSSAPREWGWGIVQPSIVKASIENPPTGYQNDAVSSARWSRQIKGEIRRIRWLEIT